MSFKNEDKKISSISITDSETGNHPSTGNYFSEDQQSRFMVKENIHKNQHLSLLHW